MESIQISPPKMPDGCRSLKVELEAKQVEKVLLAGTTEIRKGELPRGRTRMGGLRDADVAIPSRE